MNNILEFVDFLDENQPLWEAKRRNTKLLDKLVDNGLKNAQEMKKVVIEWKKAEGGKKEDLMTILKELTIKKQENEKEIDKEVQALDVGVELQDIKDNYSPKLEQVQEWAKKVSFDGELNVNENEKVIINDYVIWDYKEFLIAINN